uniref:DNA repair protein XPG n=1 Tax=Crypthecodinium cohnii TaxID=2866 RepID=A0A516AGT4_CRYCO|nr:DNA repair protein XPG [Crypthecodinium cohnii]
MGVQGLWDLASPAGERLHMTALENKVIAVDASIWLYHFLKAMRDEAGNMVKGAHVIGFFRRICKLLYLKIRPVFVFDGPPPQLKLRTLRLRAQQRDLEERQRKKAVEKLLRNQLQMHLLQAAGEDSNLGEAAAANIGGGEAPCPDADDVEVMAEDGKADDDQEEGSSGVESDHSDGPDNRRFRRWRRRRRFMPQEGFFGSRRSIADVRLPQEATPEEEPERRFPTLPAEEAQETKGLVMPDGSVVNFPLDTPSLSEEFGLMGPKRRYTLHKRLQEDLERRLSKQVSRAKDDPEKFAIAQMEAFIRRRKSAKEGEKIEEEMSIEVSRARKDGIAEGDKYVPPSSLSVEADNLAALGLGDGLAAEAEKGKGFGKGKVGKGKSGRGWKRKAPRQLQGQEPTKFEMISVTSCTSFSNRVELLGEEAEEDSRSAITSWWPRAEKPEDQALEVDTGDDGILAFFDSNTAEPSTEDSANDAAPEPHVLNGAPEGLMPASDNDSDNIDWVDIDEAYASHEDQVNKEEVVEVADEQPVKLTLPTQMGPPRLGARLEMHPEAAADVDQDHDHDHDQDHDQDQVEHQGPERVLDPEVPEELNEVRVAEDLDAFPRPVADGGVGCEASPRSQSLQLNLQQGSQSPPGPSFPVGRGHMPELDRTRQSFPTLPSECIEPVSAEPARTIASGPPTMLTSTPAAVERPQATAPETRTPTVAATQTPLPSAAVSAAASAAARLVSPPSFCHSA